jgi:hypothetical protein
MYDFLLNIKTASLFNQQKALYKCLAIGLFFVLVSCGGSTDKSKYLASSGGKPDEILWVMNEKLWEDTIGITINNRFQRSYEVLPQAEPAYFIRKKTFQEFNNDIIKKYRVIVICTSKEADIEYGSVREIIESNGIEFQKTLILNDVWAKPQLVVIVSADSNEELLQLMQKEGSKIEAAIREEENKAIDKYLYGNSPNQEAIDLIKNKFNYKFNIPLDYFVGINQEDFMWLRKETVPLSSNILLYKKVLTPEEIAGGVDWPLYARNIRDYLGKTYIASRVEGSYMTVEERFAPIVQDTIEVLGHPAIRTRGLWRIENDFMGGPYENIAWFNPKTSTYYMVDLYVHAPKEGKKKYMRHLVRMLETIEE